MSICLKIRSLIEFLLDVDPVALRFWVFEVRWYALSYVIGILFVYWYIGKVGRYLPENKKLLEALTSWMLLGAVIGGRIAYVFLYYPGFYIQFPLEILKIWHGGMSFHGGVAGAIICTWLICRKHNVPLAPLLDLCACSAPLSLVLGRIANLVNGELYGKVTNSCIGVVFSTDYYALPRHPSQIYEALLEGLVPLIIMNALYFFTKIRRYPGVISGLCCSLYCVARCISELFREPDAHIGYVAAGWITEGMLLSVVMLLAWAVIYFTTTARNYITTTL